MAYQRDGGGGGGGTPTGAGNGGAGGAGIGGGNSPGPAAVNPAQPPGQAPLAQTTSSAGRPIPIIYGTVKAPVQLVEKSPPTSAPPAAWSSAQTNHAGEVWSNAGNVYRCLLGGSSGTTGPTGTGSDPAAWVSGTAYTVGQLVTSNGNVYQCTVAGTGGSAGPVGTGTNILDNPFGSTVPHWCYMGATPYPVVVENGVIWKYLQPLPAPVYTQQFLGAVCEGPATGALSLWWDKERIVGPSSTSLGKMLQLTLGPDACNQTVPAAFDQAGYQHTALVAPLSGLGVITDTQAQLPDLAVEVQGQLFGASTPDSSPADIINDLLTHSRRGAGWAASRVDASITGTAAGAFRVYCDAAGWRFSMLIDTARAALALLADVLAATNSDAVWSGGALKVVPLGDQPIASPVYGSTGYVPANVAQYALGIDDFLDKQNPVAVQRISDADTFNCWPIEYTDRAQGYSRLPVEDPDQTDVERRGGMVRASTVALPMTYANGTYVTALSRILAQRSLNVRNTYTFRVGWRYILLEPTDIVTLTEPGIGLSATPVRITALEEAEDGTLTITAEDYPAGVQAATGYAPQAGDGYTPNERSTTAVIPTLVDGTQVGLKNGVVTLPGLSTTDGGFGALRSPTYTEDGSGNPTAGIKIDLSGTAGTGAKFAAAAIQIGGVKFDDSSLGGSSTGAFWRRLQYAIRQNAAGDYFYAGISGGAPAMSLAALNHRLWQPSIGSGNVGLLSFYLELNASLSNNYDGLRSLAFQLWFPGGAGLAADWQYMPIVDMAHTTSPVVGTNNPRHTILSVVPSGIGGAAPYGPNCYLRMVLIGVLGQSVNSDWNCNGIGVGLSYSFLGSNGNYIPGASAPPSGGSGGGGLCPAPWVPIRLAGGREIPAGDLHDGARVVGFDEHDPTRPKVGIVRTPTLGWQERYDLALSDGRRLAFSRDHRLVVDGAGWRKIQHLREGDRLVGINGPVAVKAVRHTGRGQVVSFQVLDCATYFAGGIASHNLKP